MIHNLNKMMPRLRLAQVVGLVLLTSATLACAARTGQPGAVDSDDDVVLVVTTLYPLEYFARRVGGDRARVVNLARPGVEAHDFEPTPEDIRLMDSADLIVYNGGGFEPWMDRALESIGRDGRVIVEAGAGLTGPAVQNGADAPADPHVWLDPRKAILLTEAISSALRKAAPNDAESFRRAAVELSAELAELDGRFEAGLADCRHGQFVTSHSAFGHLAHRYDLSYIALSGLAPESEPAPRDLARIADTVRASGVSFVMVEPGISPRLTQTLANEVGAEVLDLSPLESLTLSQADSGETYFSIMDANLVSLRTALECAA